VLQPSDEQLQSAKNAGVELHFTPLAKDAFVFFVNNQNPVSGLSVKQIRDIYLKKITNWKEVGGNNSGILPYQRPENSGSQTAMLKEVMKGEELPTPLQTERFAGMAGIVLEVAQYRGKEESIGYSFRFYTEEMMQDVLGLRKTQADYLQLMIDLIPKNDLDLSKKHDNYQSELQNMAKPIKLLAIDGIAPSEENIRSGTYPFTVDVYAVTAGTTNPHVLELIDWMLSPEGQELIEKTGYVGVAVNKD
jgi:phosphate transport system substrate-binding protein